MSEAASAPHPLLALMRILQFGDSALPVGAFAFSNALESAIQTEVVRDVPSLRAFVSAALRQSAQLEGVALLHAHRAAQAGDLATIQEADAALAVRRLGEEQQRMLVRMGHKLLDLALRMAPGGVLAQWQGVVSTGASPGLYPIVHAVIFAHLQLTEAEAFAVHQNGLASMMLGAALRLMKVDHYTTQALLFELAEAIPAAYERAAATALADMSSFAPVTDVLVAHHVGAHVRMFMS